MQYILVFLIFSIIGWCIDTSYRTLTKGYYSAGRKYPFSPVYGFGAVVLTLFYSYSPLSTYVSILIAGMFLTLVELAGGIFSEKILKKRFWNYSHNRFNFMGHIDLLHAFFWLILAGAYYWLGSLFPLF